ncbi:hypothetical protein [Streptomyces mirabilis]
MGLPAVRDGRFPAMWKRDRMTWANMPRSQTASAVLESSEPKR